MMGSKKTGMVQGVFWCCLEKMSSVFQKYLNFFYKLYQEQNTKLFVILTTVVQRQGDIGLGREDLLCSFPWRSLEGSFSDLGGHLLPTVSLEYGG